MLCSIEPEGVEDAGAVPPITIVQIFQGWHVISVADMVAAMTYDKLYERWNNA